MKEALPPSQNDVLLQRLFISVVAVSYLLEVVQGLDTFRLGISSKFSVEYILISVLPITFFFVSYATQSTKTRFTRLFRAVAAASAAWFLWNGLGAIINRYFTREPLKIVEVYIALALGVFIVLTIVLVYLRKRSKW